tara:strand:+ start:875 stop:1210 length:336 start_codon:yes stop_codon:yes gene_type:complete
MLIKTCKHCGIDFNFESYEKRRVGGYINECPDCVEELGTETAVKYRGVVAGDGKMAAISIVKFESEEDANAYVRSFNASSAFGHHKTNRCNRIPFQHVGANIGNTNHKGKN